MKKCFLLLGLQFLSGLMPAHEFWLRPHRYQVTKGETVRLSFRVGENFEGANWAGNRASTEVLKLYYGGITDDLRNLLSDSTRGDSLTMQFFDEGTAMVTFQSANNFIELEPDAFLSYLREDGLERVIDYRQHHNENDSTGREWYKRSVKTILQVGAFKDPACRKPTGLPLDIIPGHNPYQLKKDELLPLTIQFKGQPLPRALVKIWHRINGRTEKTEALTDESGKLTLPISIAGEWMVSTVAMERAEPGDSVHWQSYWGSLTWGYDR